MTPTCPHWVPSRVGHSLRPLALAVVAVLPCSWDRRLPGRSRALRGSGHCSGPAGHFSPSAQPSGPSLPSTLGLHQVKGCEVHPVHGRGAGSPVPAPPTHSTPEGQYPRGRGAWSWPDPSPPQPPPDLNVEGPVSTCWEGVRRREPRPAPRPCCQPPPPAGRGRCAGSRPRAAGSFLCTEERQLRPD